MNLRRVTLLFAALASGPVLAQPVDGGPAFAAPPAAGGIANVLVSLVLVIAAVLLCGWLYRRTQGLRGGPAGGVFRIVASQALGPRERIVVVEIAGKQLVLGMTASQVSTLHVFDEPVVRRPVTDRNRADGSFAERLRSMLRGGDAT